MKRRGRPNTTGAPGVARPKRGGFPVTLRHRGVTLHLGRFPTVEAGVRARRLAREALEEFEEER